MLTRTKSEAEKARDQRRKETRAEVSAAFLTAGLRTALKMLHAYAPYDAPFSDYDQGARFQASAVKNFDIAWERLRKACEPPAQLDPPGLINLVKDPHTGEWK